MQPTSDPDPLNVPAPFMHQPVMDELAVCAADQIMKMTERWCWRAIAQGIGNRLWRSPVKIIDEQMVVEFKILGPNDHPPGSGIIHGPWSKGT